MKSIMMSIRPKWVELIINGKKKKEARKKFPINYVGWVYIYCTKNGKQLVDCPQWVENELCHQLWYDKNIALLENSEALLNGKVVARFWCDKVEEINYHPYEQTYYTKTLDTVIYKGHEPTLLKVCCLSWDELDNYLKEKKGYAINISKLEIFDKPREISEFKIDITNKVEWAKDQTKLICKYRRLKTLTRAPQSWCYVEELL